MNKTVLNVMDELLPAYFDGGTWVAWRVFLCAVFGLPMTPEQMALYRTCTDRDTAPEQAAREVYLIAGRRSGKSWICALIAVFLACFYPWRKWLRLGTLGTVLVIAADRAQARVVFRYCSEFLHASPLLERMIVSETKESVELNNGVEIIVATCNYRSIRGRTVLAAICDEAAFWESETTNNPAGEVLRAIRPGMLNVRNSMLLVLSSPFAKSGPLWKAFGKWYGADDARHLVWKSDSRTMNPSLDHEEIEEAYRQDPIAAAREYGAEFASAESTFLDDELIEAAERSDGTLPPALNKHYVAFADVSGGRSDDAALGIAHADGGRVIVDGVWSWSAPHNPKRVVAAMAGILGAYHCASASGDEYAAEWSAGEFRSNGIAYNPIGKRKSDIYLETLPLFTTGQIEIPCDTKLRQQLGRLERRALPSGLERVDHPRGAHDDLSNVACGAAYAAFKHLGAIDLSAAQTFGSRMTAQYDGALIEMGMYERDEPQPPIELPTHDGEQRAVAEARYRAELERELRQAYVAEHENKSAAGRFDGGVT